MVLVVLPQHLDCQWGVVLAIAAPVGAASGVLARLLQEHSRSVRTSVVDGPEAHCVM